MSDVGDDIAVYLAWEGSLPRLVCRMTHAEWAAGKEIPRLPILSLGEINEREMLIRRFVSTLEEMYHYPEDGAGPDVVDWHDLMDEVEAFKAAAFLGQETK